MKPKANISIEITLCPEFEVALQPENQHNDKFQKLIQRFLEDCSLHEIDLTLVQFQLLVEAFFFKSIRTRPHHKQSGETTQTHHKHHQLRFPIGQDIFDLL